MNRRPAVLPWLVAAAACAAACEDGTGPPINNDPRAIAARLVALDSVLNNRVLQIQGALGLQFHAPREPGRLFADSVLGRTFEWDLLANRFVVGARAGAPPAGVRHLLYRVAGDQVLAPLAEVGTTDLVPIGTSSLRSIVRAGQDPPAADLVATGRFGTNAFDATFTGHLETAGRRLDVVAGFAADPAAYATDFDLSLRDGSLHVRSRVVQRADTGITSRYEVSYALHASGGSLTMTGWITATPTPGAWTGVVNTADVDFRLNGKLVATIHGTGATIALRDPAGALLPGDLAIALNAVFRSPGTLQFQLGSLLQPTLNVLRGI